MSAEDDQHKERETGESFGPCWTLSSPGKSSKLGILEHECNSAYRGRESKIRKTEAASSKSHQLTARFYHGQQYTSVPGESLGKLARHWRSKQSKVITSSSKMMISLSLYIQYLLATIFVRFCWHRKSENNYIFKILLKKKRLFLTDNRFYCIFSIFWRNTFIKHVHIYMWYKYISI